MATNRIMIAAAGSGKTTFLVRQALASPERNILVTTYTEENEAEIKRKFVSECGCVPRNVTVMTWFSFLIRHGVKPMQDHILDADIRGMILVTQPSGFRYQFRGRPVYWTKDTPAKYYLSPDNKLYSDKVSQLVLECNQASGGSTIARLQKIFDQIYIDEVQDLAGYDLDVIHELFRSEIDVLLVGDPRQVTYLTHHSRKYQKYRQGKIVEFVENTVRDQVVEIDAKTLGSSHRNNDRICSFSAKLYPEHPASFQCECADCHSPLQESEGVILVRPADVGSYLEQYAPVQLRWDRRTLCAKHFDAFNFGQVKGLGFDRVLIYPTRAMTNWIGDHKTQLLDAARAKLYVAITRAKLSSAIIYDFKNDVEIDGTQKYYPR